MADLKMFAGLNGPFIDLTTGKKINKEDIVDVSKVSMLKLMDGTGVQHGIDELLKWYYLKADADAAFAKIADLAGYQKTSAVFKPAYMEATLETPVNVNTQYGPSYIIPFGKTQVVDASGRVKNNGGIFTLTKGDWKIDVQIAIDTINGGGSTAMGLQFDGVLWQIINTAQNGVNSYSHIHRVSSTTSQFFVTPSNGNVTIPTTVPMGRIQIVQLS